MRRWISACLLGLVIMLWTGCGIEQTVNWYMEDDDEETEEPVTEETLP